jgi:hypothetical protein
MIVFLASILVAIGYELVIKSFIWLGCSWIILDVMRRLARIIHHEGKNGDW